MIVTLIVQNVQAYPKSCEWWSSNPPLRKRGEGGSRPGWQLGLKPLTLSLNTFTTISTGLSNILFIPNISFIISITISTVNCHPKFFRNMNYVSQSLIKWLDYVWADPPADHFEATWRTYIATGGTCCFSAGTSDKYNFESTSCSDKYNCNCEN